MRCPLCFDKIPHYSNICVSCGFNKEELNNTSNAMIFEMRDKDPEIIIESTVMPKDLKKKRLLLLCIFTGWFGGHLFYCRKYVKGTIYAIIMSILLIACPFIYGTLPIPFGIDPVDLTTWVSVPGAIVFISWLIELIQIIFNRFKIPVVLLDRV